MFDPESYTISIRKEYVEGDILYVARVSELADVVEYACSFEDARMLALDTITTSRELCIERNIPFPAPKEISSVDVSGRVTLRMPKSLHSNLITDAENECVSLNQLIVYRLASSYESNKVTSTIKDLLLPHLQNITTSIIDIKRLNTGGHFRRIIQSEELVFSSTSQRKAMWLLHKDANATEKLCAY